MKRDDAIKLILSLIACQGAGFLGSIFTRSSVSTWFPTLIKPGFAPPGWVISAIWILLFTLMGFSLFLVWRKDLSRTDVRLAVGIFAIQLMVNILWSAAFFGLRSPFAGLIVIAVLWILILLTMVKFWPISKVSAVLLLPYIIWVSFAAYLNYSILILNP